MASKLKYSVTIIAGITCLPWLRPSRNRTQGVPSPELAFLQECIEAVRVCTELMKFHLDSSVFSPYVDSDTLMVSQAPPNVPHYIGSLMGKERLEDIRVTAALAGADHSDQVQMLTSLRGLRKLTLEFLSMEVVRELPRWVSSLSSSLRDLSFLVSSGSFTARIYIHDFFQHSANLDIDALSRTLSPLTNLTSLSIEDCQGLENTQILRVLHFTPKIENLKLVIAVSKESSRLMDKTDTPLRMTRRLRPTRCTLASKISVI